MRAKSLAGMILKLKSGAINKVTTYSQMKKILEYKIIRYALAVCVSLLIFPLASILESIEPALSDWMLLVFVIVLFYSLTWAQDYPDISALKFNNAKLLFFKGVKLVVSFYVYFALLSLPFRLLVLGYEWLKFGSVSAHTTCNVVGLFCNNNYDWIGVNKALDWIGYSDIFIPLITLSLFGLVILEIISGYAEEVIN